MLGLAASASSTWVHYQLLKNPAYSSFCDVSATVSCTEAYTSRVRQFWRACQWRSSACCSSCSCSGLIALCSRSESASPNLPGYIFALSSAGLAVVLYLAYASFVVLKAVCLLCVGTYIAIIGLFLLSGAATGYPMTSLPRRAARDFGTLLRTPAALSAALAFVAAATGRHRDVPERVGDGRCGGHVGRCRPGSAFRCQRCRPLSCSSSNSTSAQQPRVPIMAPSDGAAVVIVKFNDYQCPPCRQTFMEYKSVFAKWAKDAPGKVKYMTRDYPLETQCNQFVPQDLHPCGVRGGRRRATGQGKGKGRGDGRVGLRQPAVPDARARQAGRTHRGRRHRFRRSFRHDARNW